MTLETIHFPETYIAPEPHPVGFFASRVELLEFAVDQGHKILVDGEAKIGPVILKAIMDWPQEAHLHKASARASFLLLNTRRRFKPMVDIPHRVFGASGDHCDHCLSILHGIPSGIGGVARPETCRCGGYCDAVTEQIPVIPISGLKFMRQAQKSRTLEIPANMSYEDFVEKILKRIMGDSPFIEIHDRVLGRALLQSAVSLSKASGGMNTLDEYNQRHWGGHPPEFEWGWGDHLTNYKENLDLLLKSIESIRGGDRIAVRLLTTIGYLVYPTSRRRKAQATLFVKNPQPSIAVLAVFNALVSYGKWVTEKWKSRGIDFRLDINLSVDESQGMSHGRYIITREMAFKTTHGLDLAFSEENSSGRSWFMRGERVEILSETLSADTSGSHMYDSVELRGNEKLLPASLKTINDFYATWARKAADETV